MATETTTPRDVPVKAYREFFGELPHRDNRSIDWSEYCARGMAAAPCETCSLVNYRRDCHNNALSETAPRE